MGAQHHRMSMMGAQHQRMGMMGAQHQRMGMLGAQRQRMDMIQLGWMRRESREKDEDSLQTTLPGEMVQDDDESSFWQVSACDTCSLLRSLQEMPVASVLHFLSNLISGQILLSVSSDTSENSLPLLTSYCC